MTSRRYLLQLTAEVFRLDRSDGAARRTPGRNGRSSSQLVALAFSDRHDLIDSLALAHGALVEEWR
jgi:hypothetical protein